MTTSNDELLVKAPGVTKVFGSGEIAVHALRGVGLEIRGGEFMALVGPSGSGKTTLLNLIGALDQPTGGKLDVLGHDLTTPGKRQRAELPLQSIGR